MRVCRSDLWRLALNRNAVGCSYLFIEFNAKNNILRRTMKWLSIVIDGYSKRSPFLLIVGLIEYTLELGMNTRLDILD
ncbi:hypothetical protein Trydic_g458 [Trypoxylus dichotomus]